MHAVPVEPSIPIGCIRQAKGHDGSGVSNSLVPERPLFGLTRLLVRFLTHIHSLFLGLHSSGSSLCD